MSGNLGSIDEEVDDMGSRKAARSEPELDRVVPYVEQLVAVQRDRPAFERVFSDITANKSLAVADVVEIALRYRGGGGRPASRRAALEAISKRFLELVRIKAQITQAAKARPW
jgi:hypothetical protein